jgi:hypothetical protein
MSMSRHQTSLWARMILILSWTQQTQDLRPTSSILHIPTCFLVVQLSMLLTTWPIGLPLCSSMPPMPVQWCINFNALPQGFLDGWETKFYPGGLTTTALVDDQRRYEQPAVENDNAKRQADERRERHERCNKQHDEQGGGGRRMAIFDLLLNYKYIVMEPEVGRATRKNCRRRMLRGTAKCSRRRLVHGGKTFPRTRFCCDPRVRYNANTQLSVCVPSLSPAVPSRSATYVVVAMSSSTSSRLPHCPCWFECSFTLAVLSRRRCCGCSPSSLHVCRSFHLIYYLITTLTAQFAHE